MSFSVGVRLQLWFLALLQELVDLPKTSKDSDGQRDPDV